ncbi:D-amino-acid oxidase [Candida viswanathii]|uniref:D-amino-acid oxidase n=1 Tax=Candida viswanathii TaxID=5486 RepID=A0A367Y6A8_9ASCO|nr:D-amino-acid oxidase [Candida viswanathii]
MTLVVVLGAGVIGLTTALELKRWNPKLDITIAAHHWPGDMDPSYTSPYAGANWQSFATPEDKNLQDIDKPGYKKFLQLADGDPRAGVWTTENLSYFTDYEVSSQKGNFKEMIPWYRDFVDDFKIIDSLKLPPGIGFAHSFKGVVISVPTYLKYLVQQNKEIGNKLKKIPIIYNIEKARDYHSSGKKADYVVNATGLSATSIKGVEDNKLTFPVRGQVLLVKNNARIQYHVHGFPGFPNELLYIMPRKEGGTIIGGCFLPGETNKTEDKDMTERIIRRALKYAPELIDPSFKKNPLKIEIAQVNVGFRPFREDGARVELDKSKKWLIHNYGAGGGGYQGSYGLAKKVVDIFKSELPSGKSKL